MSRMKQWVPLMPDSTSQIRAIQDEFTQALDMSVYHAEDTPHITMLPAFRCDEEALAAELSSLRETHLPLEVTFDSYHIYPSVENPMVIALEPSDGTALESLRSDLRSAVQSVGGTQVLSPKPFHLTLVKGGDSGDEDEFVASEHDITAVEERVSQQHGVPLSVQFTSFGVRSWES